MLPHTPLTTTSKMFQAFIRQQASSTPCCASSCSIAAQRQMAVDKPALPQTLCLFPYLAVPQHATESPETCDACMVPTLAGLPAAVSARASGEGGPAAEAGQQSARYGEALAATHYITLHYFNCHASI
jgi:hypothetical protein